MAASTSRSFPGPSNTIRKRSNPGGSDNEGPFLKASRDSFSYYYVLEPETQPPSDEDTESIYSLQDKPTDSAKDTSDLSSSDGSDEVIRIGGGHWVSVPIGEEYEPASLSEHDEPLLPGVLSSASDSEHIEKIETIGCEFVISVTGSSSTCDEDTWADTSSISSEFEHEIDPELSLRDYWSCVQCKATNNNPMFRYCEKCFKVRKNFFPPRPKGKNKKSKPKRRKKRQRLSSDIMPSCSNSNTASCIDSKPVSMSSNIGDFYSINKSNESASTFINCLINSSKDKERNSSKDLPVKFTHEVDGYLSQCSTVILDSNLSHDEFSFTSDCGVRSSCRNNEVKDRKSSNLDRNTSESSVVNNFGKLVCNSNNGISNKVDSPEINCIGKSNQCQNLYLVNNADCSNNNSNSLQINNDDEMRNYSNLSTADTVKLDTPSPFQSSSTSGFEDMKEKNSFSNDNNASVCDTSVDMSSVVVSTNKNDKIVQCTLKNNSSQLCETCMSRPKDGVFVHGSKIGHMFCCYQCSKKVWRDTGRCPLCNCKDVSMCTVSEYESSEIVLCSD